MSQFKYWIEVTRAVKKADGLYIEGEASNTSVDAYDTVFTDNCQQGFVDDIRGAYEAGKPLQIEIEHEGDVAPIFNIGSITDASIDQSRTKIVARLDNANPLANYYHTILTSTEEENRMNGRPDKLGFSVRGTIEDSRRDYSSEAQRYITHYERVKLRKVGLTEKPANNECYAEAIKRSIADKDELTIKRDQMEDLTNSEIEAVETVVEPVEAEVEVSVEDTVEDNGQSEEVTEATESATDNQEAEVGSSEEGEVEEKEVIETAEVVDENLTVDEVVATEPAAEEVSEIVDEEVVQRTEPEVSRGVLADTLAANELMEELEELTSTFQNLMWRAVYCSMDSNTGLGELKALTEEFSQMLHSLQPEADRSLDTSDTSLQKESVSDELTYSVNTIAMSLTKRSAKAEKVSNEITRAKELNDKVTELTRSLEVSAKEVDELKVKNDDLIKRNEELSKLPASLPAKQVIDEEVDRKAVVAKKLSELKRSGDKQAIAKLILENLNTK